ncbi:MAG: YihY/virulence factor BrkB family protein [Bacteroidota bacterium]|nr:YihY/virulence factor BrkB family protein [Bacteroidota bacterium]MDP4206835.1 YihY/virulence factor BrkB family protein [Bacteroidota bacterium]
MKIPGEDRLYRKWDSIVSWSDKITFPGFKEITLYDVSLFFWEGFQNGSIATRASAIAYNFFMALFPAIIFLFTLIPYIPIANFQIELFLLIQSVLPENAFLTIETTITDIITRPRGGLLSIGFVAAMIFSTNGIAAMMAAFDATNHTYHKRRWVNQRLISIILVFILSFLLSIAITLITVSQWIIDYLVVEGILKVNFTFYLLILGKWIVIIALFFFAFSFLYYMAPAKKSKWKFISAGGTLATILSIFIAVGFSYYINHFGKYNTLYGSIGTILVLMLWLYINSYILILGFELNVSINQAHIEKKAKLRLPKDPELDQNDTPHIN